MPFQINEAKHVEELYNSVLALLTDAMGNREDQSASAQPSTTASTSAANTPAISNPNPIPLVTKKLVSQHISAPNVNPLNNSVPINNNLRY